MHKLMRLRDYVHLLPSAEFLAADVPSGLAEFDSQRDSESVNEEIDVSSLDKIILDTMSSLERYETKMDAAIAIDLHKSLAISRRTAADVRMWAWLGLAKFPDFVAYRWKPSVKADGLAVRSRERFCGGPVRQTLARLWWAAELTVGDPCDYSLTQKLLALSGFQNTYEAIFGRAFCQYRPALAAFVDVVGEESEPVVEKTAKELGYVLTTMVLEAMEEGEVAELLTELVGAVKTRVAA